ncbi:olfactory receptor 1M1-like [Poecilia reticulata]|uniref:olfactory receptor 1M1-like n=1 Tax=Poecilia reticulata TaxID=8081 RepID=UPI0004A2443E|nr:PREDICTED: olfactory receptor 1M1-like [Poecilia reticulata]
MNIFASILQMSFVSQPRSNTSVELNDVGLLERVITFTLCTIPSCVFLFINGTILFTLRSKSVLRDTCRYILLSNLLLVDTAQLVISQVLFLLSISRITLTYPVCGMLTVFANITNVISPLTLMLMSLERCAAVCLPLRHAMIVTIRNTRLAIIAVWISSSLHNIFRVILMLDFPFKDLDSLQMPNLCNEFNMLLGSRSKVYDNAFTGFLFASAATVIISSYIGVIMAARSASTGKASAQTARNTLMLHFLQLCLSLSSTIYNTLLVALLKIIQSVGFIRLNKFLYVLIILFPRCLSSLIYGLRDHTIRPILLGHLGCQRKLKTVPDSS